MSSIDAMSADELARACAERMQANDRASAGLGMKITHVAAGEATLEMPVRDDMTNGQDICHGGFIFTLADSAFAYACNGYNQFTVAQGCTIEFLAPAYKGNNLIAHAREIHRAGRAGIYDVTVRAEDGSLIAEFRGKSRTVKGTHL